MGILQFWRRRLKIMVEDKHTKKQNALAFTVASAFTVAAVLLFMPVAALAAGSAPEKLSQLEQSIVGQTSAGVPIEQRLKQLEKRVFAKAQTGSLTSRISALEKFAGISSSDYMPPLPPQFDNGKGPVRRAPEMAATSKRIVSPTNMRRRSITPGNSVEAGVAGVAIPSATSSSTNGSKSPKPDSVLANQATATHKPLNGELEEAVKLHHEGKDYEAEKSLKAILGRDPKNADAYFSLGAIAETNGDLHSALDYYSSAMQANPSDPEASQAVAELSRKIAAADNGPFVNPLEPPVAPPPNVLQGRALSVNAAAGAYNGTYTTQTAINSPPIATLPVTQPNRNPSFARSFARAALGVALTGTGLHCPVCQLMKGF